MEVVDMYADQSAEDTAGKASNRFRTPESYIHWDRGLAIVAGMIGILLLFVLLLTTLPIRNNADREQITGLAEAPAPTAQAQPPPASAAPAPTPATGPSQPRLAAIARQFPYVRRGPGTNFAIAMNLTQGQRVEVVGRSPDRQWFQIVRPDNPSERAWVSAEFLAVEGDVNSLPEVREQ
jgi:uncharacterized protein YgiM (DUF1202 family)